MDLPPEGEGLVIDEYEDAVLTAHLEPLELGKTLIVYHPHARKLPKIINNEAAQSGPSSGDDSPYKTAKDIDDVPWRPFKTLADFEQAALFLRYDCADPHIDAQLALTRGSSNSSNITLQNAREVHRLLADALDTEDLTNVSSVFYYCTKLKLLISSPV